jgi:copper chaperone NosL
MIRHLPRLLAAVLLLLAACSKQEAALPKPLEPDANSIAYFCHMSLPEHEGPKGQAFMKGQDKPFWFASAGEAFVFLQTELYQTGDLQVLYVNDMGQGSWEHPAAGAWIDIKKAVFVVGSSKAGSMGDAEAVPFSERATAEAFARQFGGQVVDFDAAAKAMAIDQPDAPHTDDHDS